MHELKKQSPINIYNLKVEKGEILADNSQHEAIQHLNSIWEKLEFDSKRFFSSPVKGLYMWGEVGSGKTWLMDTFYNSLSFQKKVRMHFHHFLKNIHKQLIEYRGTPDPLKHIANDLVKKYKLICFDEFFVTNVADAMILSNLFNFLFDNNIILVATSNIHPDDLYKNGLNRDKFLKTIQHINKHCAILKIGNDLDYRTIKENSTLNGFYKSQLNIDSEQWLSSIYKELSHDQRPLADSIEINNRIIEVKATHNNIIWFEFDKLCREARSPADYIEIASNYDFVLISGIGDLTDSIYDTVRRFIYLIDELYDQKIILYFTASKNINELYLGKRLQFEFQRTLSRLTEMQSSQYGN